jgi:hypothetical protein
VPSLHPPIRLFILVACLVTAGCAAALEPTPSEEASLSPGPVGTPLTEPTPTTEPPAATEPPVTDADPTEAAPTEPGSDDGSATGAVSGTWVGVGCNTRASCNYEVRMHLRQIAGMLRADVIWESGGNVGPVDNGGRGMLEGNSLTITFTSSGANLRKVYEGTVVDGTFSGTVTTFLGDLEAPAGPGSFEVTREP